MHPQPIQMINLQAPSEPPKNPNHRRAWIIFQLRTLNMSLATIAAEEGVSTAAVSKTLLMPNSRLEEAIAKKLGLTARALFPERFDEHGHRFFRIGEPKRNTATPRGERRKKAVG
jgi:lambda repressor-like predicted transcriptional regulator